MSSHLFIVIYVRDAFTQIRIGLDAWADTYPRHIIMSQVGEKKAHLALHIHREP